MWAGRTVIVTGATKGIGRATALLFGRLGADTVVAGRDRADADAVVAAIHGAGGSASAVLGDLRDPDFCVALVKDVASANGRIDALINNAGATLFKGTLHATIEDWDDCLNLDLRAAWLCSREAARFMPPGSAIVNVSSNHAASTMPNMFPYNVAKAGLNALTQSLAIELAPLGIRANAVAPGYVETPLIEDYFDSFSDPASARVRAEQLHLVGRLGHPEEIAYAIEYLADTSRSGFTDGTILTIDGGRSTLMQDAQ